MGYSVACNRGIITIRDDPDGECNTLEDVEHVIRVHANQHFINQITMVSLDGTSVPVAWDSGDLTVYVTPDQLKPAKVSGSLTDRRYIIVGLALLILAGYFFATPYLTIASIKSSLSERNAEALSENIDFPVLRQNLKDQLNFVVMNAGMNELDDNPFSGLVTMMASNMVDGMVDAFISPTGLASIMQGEEPSLGTDNTQTGSPTKEDLLKDAEFSYDSLNQFSVTIENEEEDQIKLILQRDWFSWKLINIVLPMDA